MNGTNHLIAYHPLARSVQRLRLAYLKRHLPRLVDENNGTKTATKMPFRSMALVFK